MIPAIKKLISDEYLVVDKKEGNNLILQEDSNIGGSGLKTVKLNVRNVSDFAVYKFDQAVTIQAQKYKTYAHFLKPGEGQAMCDFIIFFCPEISPEKLYAWVVNLKSKNDGNNVSQMLAGGRLCDLLAGKLQDLFDGIVEQTDYILFSQPKTNGTLRKTTTNPIAGEGAKSFCVATNGPKDFLRVLKGAVELTPLIIES